MKKLLALMLAAALALSLAACGGGGGTGDTNTPSGGSDDTTPPTAAEQEEAKNDTYKSIECEEVVLHPNEGDLKMKMLGYEIVEYEGNINFFIRLNIANETNKTFATFEGYGPFYWQLFQDGIEVHMADGGYVPPDELVTYPENNPAIKAGAETDKVVICWMLDDIDYDAEFELSYNEHTIAAFFISEAGEKAASNSSEPDREENSSDEAISIQQVDEQLQGTWIDTETDNLVIKWTFHDGNYVIDAYVDGERRDNHTTGTYAIGAETIETVHSNGVKGAIPYSVIAGALSLGEDDELMYKEEM